MISTKSIAHGRQTGTDIARSRRFYDAVFGWPVLLEAARRITAGQQHGAVFEARHGARRLGVVALAGPAGVRRLVEFVVVDPDASVVPVSL